MKTIYLGIPYSKIDFNKSFEIVNKVSADLMKQGYRVFSPITLGHSIANYLPEKIRIDSNFWLNQFLYFIKYCDELHMIEIGENGKKYIEESTGCRNELLEAWQNDKPIKYIKYV